MNKNNSVPLTVFFSKSTNPLKGSTDLFTISNYMEKNNEEFRKDLIILTVVTIIMFIIIFLNIYTQEY